ncbi:hypothetical protein KEJ18_02190 [Candidatus Bathyarchaeota archaeon]|nr:hypothetical protein [Candidatus Bathyarchaeota archaeon]
MNKNRIVNILACLLLVATAAAIISFLYVGNVPGGSDWSTHLSKIRFIADNLPSFPRWCPESGFGTPFLWDYPPFSYYSVALLSWVLGINIFEGCKLFFMLILAIAAISTYALAAELGLSRAGSFASGLLLLGSYNIYAWWWIGQLPNITAVLFTPLALLAFIRAAKKQTLFRIMLAGVSFVPVVLSHLLNTLIFALILVVTSIVLIVLKPELLYIPRGIGQPPIYTLKLPKIFLLSALEAFALCAWWWLPFLLDTNLSVYFSTISGYGMITTGTGNAFKLNSLLAPSLYYAGLGHFLLLIVSFGILVTRKEKIRDFLILPYVWFLLNVFCSIAPYLNIPMVLPFRFGPYMTLAASLLCGVSVTFFESSYRKISKQVLFRTFFVLLVSACSMYPSVMEVKHIFGTLHTNTPAYVSSLSNVIKEGERLGTGSVGWINVYSNVPVSYGANTWGNDLAYKFWYFMYYNFSSECVPFFAKNFNVKYFLEPPKQTPYLSRTETGLYEVVGFNSSFVETTEGKTLVLFIGEETEYVEYFFLSISATDALDLLLVYGGKFLEEMDQTVLQHFNVIYMSGIFYRDKTKFTSVLSQYVESGGGLILDTGEVDDADVPELSPVTSVASRVLTYNLSTPSQNEVTNGVDLQGFSERLRSSGSMIVYADNVRDDAVTLLNDGDSPVIVYRKYGEGKVVWTGLKLPYLAMLHRNISESKMLVNVIRYVSSSPSTGRTAATFDTGIDSITVDVMGATEKTGIWVKMSYHPSWVASASNTDIGTRALKIFKAGPNMMLVFPETNGNYKLSLSYGKSLALQAGEIAGIMGILAIFVSFVAGKWRIPLGWEKTTHKGSGYKQN